MVAGTDVGNYLDIINRVDLPPVVVVRGALIALDQRAVLLYRAAAVPVDPNPEGREGGSGGAADAGLCPAAGDRAEAAAGVCVP